MVGEFGAAGVLHFLGFVLRSCEFMGELKYLQEAPTLTLQAICLTSDLPLMFLDNLADLLLPRCPLFLSFDLALLGLLSTTGRDDFAGLELRPLDHGLSADHLID